MSAKNALAIQRCELLRKELDEFLSFYLIPSEYRVILTTSTQTILDAPLGKRVGPLPTHCLAVRHSVDYYSSDHFSLDDSSSSSSLETSLDSSADASSDFASSRSSSNHSFSASPSGMRPSHHLCSLVPSIHRSSIAIFDRPSHDSSFASPSRKRSRSPIAFVLLSSPVLGALSSSRVDRLPSPKRIRSPESVTDLEGCSEDSFEPYVPREVGLGVDVEDESSEQSRSRGTDIEMDVDVERSDEPHSEPEIQAEIDECIAYVDALKANKVDVRVEAVTIARYDVEASARGLVEGGDDRVTYSVLTDDVQEPTQEGAVEGTYETLGDLRDQGHRIVATGQQSADMLERIQELERDNRRLRDIVMLIVSESLRLIPGGIGTTVLRLFCDYPSVDPTMPNTRSGASRTREGVNEQNDHRMSEALRARDSVRNLGPLMGDEGEQEEVIGNGGNGNGGNGNGGNGNGNGNGGEYGYNFRRFMPAIECTYQDFLKCQPLNFNGTEGVVSALTWWNSHKRTIGIEAAYAMSWVELIKLMTEVYGPRIEVQKMETVKSQINRSS
ncbi:hypothetical protein Tco_0157166 [Tanacetum coccineum]